MVMSLSVKCEMNMALLKIKDFILKLSGGGWFEIYQKVITVIINKYIKFSLIFFTLVGFNMELIRKRKRIKFVLLFKRME